MNELTNMLRQKQLCGLFYLKIVFNGYLEEKPHVTKVFPLKSKSNNDPE